MHRGSPQPEEISPFNHTAAVTAGAALCLSHRGLCATASICHVILTVQGNCAYARPVLILITALT